MIITKNPPLLSNLVCFKDSRNVKCKNVLVLPVRGCVRFSRGLVSVISW